MPTRKRRHDANQFAPRRQTWLSQPYHLVFFPLKPMDKRTALPGSPLSADYLQARSLNPKTISKLRAGHAKVSEAGRQRSGLSTRDELQAVLIEWQVKGTALPPCSDAWLPTSITFSLREDTSRADQPLMFAPKGWVRVPRAPAADDLERVIAAIGHDDPFHVRDRAILLLFRDTGVRASAVAHLPERCRYSGTSLDHWQRQFGKQHQVRMSVRTAEAIQEYIDNARSYFVRDRIAYLFTGYHRKKAKDANGPMTRQQLCNIAKGWTKKVLGVAISPHKWRAACFTECAEKEMDVFDLMNLAGHSSPEVTQRYIRHQLGHLKQAYCDASPCAKGCEAMTLSSYFSQFLNG